MSVFVIDPQFLVDANKFCVINHQIGDKYKEPAQKKQQQFEDFSAQCKQNQPQSCKDANTAFQNIIDKNEANNNPPWTWSEEDKNDADKAYKIIKQCKLDMPQNCKDAETKAGMLDQFQGSFSK
jgi:hypothetical protein